MILIIMPINIHEHFRRWNNPIYLLKKCYKKKKEKRKKKKCYHYFEEHNTSLLEIQA
jgi:hypothetical protein